MVSLVVSLTSDLLHGIKTLILPTLTAGGYDALFLLIIEPSSTPVNAISTIESIWGGWKELSLCPLSCSADKGGLKLESIDEVDGLKEVLEKGRR